MRLFRQIYLYLLMVANPRVWIVAIEKVAGSSPIGHPLYKQHICRQNAAMSKRTKSFFIPGYFEARTIKVSWERSTLWTLVPKGSSPRFSFQPP
jgi:hypothetical protein